MLTGCTHLGQRVERIALPPGTPEIESILADLSANDSAISSFKATGSFTLESPDLSGTKTFKNGLILFRRPADLSVLGRNHLNIAVFRLTSVGSEFLIEFPASRDEPYYQFEGEQFANVPFSVSPSDIAREMFLPEQWTKIGKRDARIVAYDSTGQTAVIEIGAKRAPRRRIVVSGPPWVVVHSERLNEKDGTTLAVTAREDYTDISGIKFPTSIDADFPTEQTRMSFKMRKIFPNIELDKAEFDIRARARELGIYTTGSGAGKRNP